MDGLTDRRIGDLMIAAKVISETPWVQKKLERSTMLLMGKSTISMAIFNSKLLVYQRVSFSQNIWVCLKIG